MKVKTMKLLVFAATILLTISLLTTTVFAAPAANSIIGSMQNTTGTVNTTTLTTLGGKILNILQVIGIIVGTIILVVLGLKYMTGSLEEKAEYKKTMIPYLVGAVIIFAAPSLAKGIFTMIASL